METVILKIALPVHDADRVTALLDMPCACGECDNMPEKEQILSILGYVSDEVTVTGMGATAAGVIHLLTDTGWILDARIENRKEFEGHDRV